MVFEVSERAWNRQPGAALAQGRMKFHPDRWAKVYDHWLSNIQDWCISRQLWWGHRIPVWSKDHRYDWVLAPVTSKCL
jgi:valyl-tRNA synthetase